MSFMTKIEGVADTDQAIPGMAFFAGAGPEKKTCGNCKHRGLIRESRKAKWSERTQQFVHKTYRTNQCKMFKKLAGVHGAAVKKDYAACKYFEDKDPPKVKPSPQGSDGQ